MKHNRLIRSLMTAGFAAVAASAMSQAAGVTLRTIVNASSWGSSGVTSFGTNGSEGYINFAYTSAFSGATADGFQNPTAVNGCPVRPQAYRDDFTDLNYIEFDLENTGASAITLQGYSAAGDAGFTGTSTITVPVGRSWCQYTGIASLTREQKSCVHQYGFQNGSTATANVRLYGVRTGTATNQKYYQFDNGLMGANLNSDGDDNVVGSVTSGANAWQSGLTQGTDGALKTLHFELTHGTNAQAEILMGNGFQPATATAFTNYDWTTIDFSNYDTLNVRLKATAVSGTPTQTVQFYIQNSSFAQSYTGFLTFTADGQYTTLHTALPVGSNTTADLQNMFAWGMKVNQPAVANNVTFDVDYVVMSVGNLPVTMSGFEIE